MTKLLPIGNRVEKKAQANLVRAAMKAVFFDRDGTLIKNKHYLDNPDGVELLPGVVDSLRSLRKMGYNLYIVSNQSGIARGYFTLSDLMAVHKRICLLFYEHGVIIDDWRFCPHHPEGIIVEYRMECTCRKPQPGMILDMAGQYNVDLSKSYMIGDQESDILAGKRAGCRTILLTGTEVPLPSLSPDSQANLVCRTMKEAVEKIRQNK